MFPHGVNASGPDLPMRLPREVAAYILAANERDMISEPGCEHVDQLPAMIAFFRRHVVEYLGGRGILLAQGMRKVRVNPRVFLFIADGESQNLSFTHFIKAFHAKAPIWNDYPFRMILKLK
jgi:hypothetical protein